MTSEVPDLDVFAGTRTTAFTVDLLDADGQYLGPIRGVTGGNLTLSAATSVKVGGSIDVVDVDGIDWTSARVRIRADVNGHGWPLGVFVPSAPSAAWADGVRSWTVELLGMCTTLDQDRLPTSLSYPAGTVVTDAVRAQIMAAGQSGAAVTDSPATLAGGMVWEAGTSRLQVINDMLAAAGYWSLSTDGDGRFVAEPYVRPAERDPRYGFLDGDDAIYLDAFTRDQDVYSIPNRVVLVGVADGATPALTATAENTNPDSPWGYPRRGYWITYAETGIEATSQSALDALARRRLIDMSSATATVNLQHALVPLDLNDVVRLRRVPAGIDARHTVQSMTIPLDPLGLVSTTLREVVDL